MSETTNPTTAVHPIVLARSGLESAGLLGTLGGTLILLGGLLSTLDDEFVEGAGDFFYNMASFSLFAVPLLLVGMLLGVGPRLFFRWDRPLGAGVVAVTAATGLVASLAATVFLIGSTAVAIARASDDQYDIGAGDWMLQLAFAISAVGALVLAGSLLRVLFAAPSGVQRPAPQVIG